MTKHVLRCRDDAITSLNSSKHGGRLTISRSDNLWRMWRRIGAWSPFSETNFTFCWCMDWLWMTIGCIWRRGPQEACYELHMCACARSTACSRFALLLIPTSDFDQTLKDYCYYQFCCIIIITNHMNLICPFMHPKTIWSMYTQMWSVCSV